MMVAVCSSYIVCVGCAVLLWCINVIHSCGVCSSYILCVLSCATLFLCVIYVKVAARVVIICVHGGACVPPHI